MSMGTPRNRQPAGQPTGGQFSETSKGASGLALNDDRVGEPLDSLGITPDEPLQLSDYDTGDAVFPFVEVTQSDDGSYRARGEVPIDLDGYAYWTRGVGPADQEQWLVDHHDELAAAVKEEWGYGVEPGFDGDPTMMVEVDLDPARDDSSTITTRLHEKFPKAKTTSAGSATAQERYDFFERLHHRVIANRGSG